MSTCKITSDLRIYAILNLAEPPRLLISKYGKKQFHCYFGLPLPAQIIIFRLGKYTSIGYDSRMSINVCLDSDTPSFQMGYLEKGVHSICFEPKWSEDILKRSYILHEKDHMAKLLLTIDDGDKNSLHKPLSNVTTEKFQQLEKRQLVVKLSNEPFPTTTTSSSPERPPKIPDSECTKPKRKRDSMSTDCNNNHHLVQTTLASCFSKITKKCNIETHPEPKLTTQEEYFCVTNNKINNGICPSGRWGHAACVVDDSKVVIIGGQGENYQMVKDSLYIFDSESSNWTAKTSQGSGADRRMGHTSTFDPVKKVIYVYGGCKNKRWFKDIHILNIETWKWTDIKAVGNAPRRAYHTSVLFQGELLVFGGVYPNPDPKPDGCSNDLYMFNPETSSWYQPIVTGSQPLPRSGHSFKLYSKDKAILFGGWDTPKCYNDVFFLDLALMEYIKPSVIGIAPCPRSWHSSTMLAGNQLLIHGGFDGANNKVLGDSFMFDIEKLTWLKVNSCPEIQPRVGHVMFCDSMNTDKEEILVFGGGDNMGSFFSDLVAVHTFTKNKP